MKLFKQAKRPSKRAKKTKKAKKPMSKRFSPKRLIPRYFIDSFKELKKVEWPGRKEAWMLTVAVFIYSFVYLVYIVAIDDVFKKVSERLFIK